MLDAIQNFDLPQFPPPEYVSWYNRQHPGRTRGVLDPDLLLAWMEATAWARM